ncbi:MAG TPA: hypothetical protein PKK26_16865, partial [Candidatus Wallbacteria bacterium]|nr:hypothetical protein [Candidatus Wallbacteria bacterium]
LFDLADASTDEAFEKIARDYFYKSKVYEAWSEAYSGRGIYDETVRDLEKAETIAERGLLAGCDDPRGLLEELLALRQMRLEDEMGRPGPLVAGLERAEKWEEKFRRSSITEKIALLSDASESGAAREMIYYIQIAGHFMTAFGTAISSGKNAGFFELLCDLQKNRRELYLIFSDIIDNFIISHLIYKGEFDRALTAASEFCLKNIANQVLTAGVIEKFMLCRKTKDAIALAERVTKKRWPELIDKFRVRLGHLLFNYDMQNEYIKLKNDGAPSRAADLERSEICGKIFQAEEIASALEMLRGSFPLSGRRPDFRSKIEKLYMLPRARFLISMTPDFAAFMFEKHGVDFPLSHIFWSRFVEFIETDRDGIFGPTPTAKLFAFSSDRLKKYVKSSAGSDFFPFEEIAPVLAGGPFVYEYLFESGLIEAALRDRSTGFFSAMRKYAANKYPGKMWALEFAGVLNK